MDAVVEVTCANNVKRSVEKAYLLWSSRIAALMLEANTNTLFLAGFPVEAVDVFIGNSALSGNALELVEKVFELASFLDATDEWMTVAAASYIPKNVEAELAAIKNFPAMALHMAENSKRWCADAEAILKDCCFSRDVDDDDLLRRPFAAISGRALKGLLERMVSASYAVHTTLGGTLYALCMTSEPLMRLFMYLAAALWELDIVPRTDLDTMPDKIACVRLPKLTVGDQLLYPCDSFLCGLIIAGHRELAHQYLQRCLMEGKALLENAIERIACSGWTELADVVAECCSCGETVKRFIGITACLSNSRFIRSMMANGRFASMAARDHQAFNGLMSRFNSCGCGVQQLPLEEDAANHARIAEMVYAVDPTLVESYVIAYIEKYIEKGEGMVISDVGHAMIDVCIRKGPSMKWLQMFLLNQPVLPADVRKTMCAAVLRRIEEDVSLDTDFIVLLIALVQDHR
jgi:hypothetical protein